MILVPAFAYSVDEVLGRPPEAAVDEVRLAAPAGGILSAVEPSLLMSCHNCTRSSGSSKKLISGKCLGSYFANDEGMPSLPEGLEGSAFCSVAVETKEAQLTKAGLAKRQTTHKLRSAKAVQISADHKSCAC